MKAVFLIIDYVPHQVLSIKTLMKKTGAQVLAFHVGRFRKEVPDLGQGFNSVHYQTLQKNEILQKIMSFNPDVVIAAGWMISDYIWICKQLRKTTDIPIVAMSDTQWYGTWKQRMNVLISPFYLKQAFTHLWVAGVRQYEYARRLGFDNESIIFNSLCGDMTLFSKVEIETKKISYPKNFIYIGGIEKGKGLKNLLDAWKKISDKNGWTFTIIGDGTMKIDLADSNQFILKGSKSQKELVDEFQNSGCFVLPSLHEQWALVIHEAAIAGLPILCTEICGAAPHFVINNFNGFRIKNNSIDDLKNKLEFIINMPFEELICMSKNSRNLSCRITPEIHTASLLQVITK